MRTAIIAGIVIGVAYTLSPLTVLCLAALIALTWRLSRELTPRERAWLSSVVAIAMAIRLAAIAALFLLADPSKPYANFFGDEELFKSRTIWLRNVGLGIPVSPASRVAWSKGISPRNSSPSSSAAILAPPCPKISYRLPVSGATK